MPRTIPQVAGIEDHGSVEQRFLAFGRILELGQEFVEYAQLRFLDQRQLLDLGRVLAMVRGVVMTERHAVNPLGAPGNRSTRR